MTFFIYFYLFGHRIQSDLSKAYFLLFLSWTYSVLLVVWKPDWKRLFMVQNARYWNGPPSHVTLPFEYLTPLLSSIKLNPVFRWLLYSKHDLNSRPFIAVEATFVACKSCKSCLPDWTRWRRERHCCLISRQPRWPITLRRRRSERWPSSIDDPTSPLQSTQTRNLQIVWQLCEHSTIEGRGCYNIEVPENCPNLSDVI